MRRVFAVPALCEFADGLVGRVALATSGFGQEVSGTVIGTVVDSTVRLLSTLRLGHQMLPQA